MSDERKNIALFFYQEISDVTKAYTLQLIDELSDEFHFLILVLEGSRQFPKFSEELEERNINFKRVLYKNKPGLSEIRELRNILKDYNINALQSYGTDADFISFLLKRFLPNLVWISDKGTPDAFQKSSDKKNWFRKYITQHQDWSIHRTTRTTTNVLEDMGRTQQEYLVYPVGLKSHSSIISRIKNDRVRFVFSESFTEQSGVMDVLRAFILLRANRKGLKLLLAGQGPLSGKIYDLVYEYKIQNEVAVLKNRLDRDFAFQDRDVYVCADENLEQAHLLDQALQSGANLLVVSSTEWKAFFANQPLDLFFRKNDPYDLYKKMKQYLDPEFCERQLGYIQTFAKTVLPEYDFIKRFRELYRVV